MPVPSVLTEQVQETMDIVVRVVALHSCWSVIYWEGCMRKMKIAESKVGKLGLDLHFHVSLFRVAFRVFAIMN